MTSNTPSSHLSAELTNIDDAQRDAKDLMHSVRGSLSDIAPSVATSQANLVIESYLIASSGHLTPAERIQLDAGYSPNPQMVVSLTGDYGWLVHLGDNSTRQNLAHGLSAGFAGVVSTAREHGLFYVRFDADGPVMDGIETYDDE